MSLPKEEPLTSFVIAVDGPAASGKGTIAAGLGKGFDLPVLDTGLLYRCVGVLMRRAGQDLDDDEAATACALVLTPTSWTIRRCAPAPPARPPAGWRCIRGSARRCWNSSAPSPGRRAARCWTAAISAR